MEGAHNSDSWEEMDRGTVHDDDHNDEGHGTSDIGRFEELRDSHDEAEEEEEEGEFDYGDSESDLLDYDNMDIDDEDDGNNGELGQREGAEDETERPPYGSTFSLQDILGSIARNMTTNTETRHNEGDDDEAEEDGEGDNINFAGGFPGLLNMLGASGNGGMRVGRANQKWAKLVDNVSHATDDPYIAMESLRELSEHLLMMNQILLDRTIPVETLLKGIVRIFSEPTLIEELELQMMACRCLYNLFEVDPDIIPFAVNMDCVSSLLDKLQEISYIDLAEQVLEITELISRSHPRSVLQSGKLSSCIQYLDFFTVHAQRKAVSIVSNSCARIRVADFNYLHDLFPILGNIFVTTSDNSITSKLINTLCGICGGLDTEAMLQPLFTNQVLEHFIVLISTSDIQLGERVKCIDILSKLTIVGNSFATTMVENFDMLQMLQDCFRQYSKSQTAAFTESLMYVPKSLLNSASRFMALLFPSEEAPLSTTVSEKMDLLFQSCIPLLADIYLNTVEYDIRRYILLALTRASTFMTQTTAHCVKTTLTVLVGSALSQCEHAVTNASGDETIIATLIVGVLTLLDVLITRYSEEFVQISYREGIFDTIKKLQSLPKLTSTSDSDTNRLNSQSEESKIEDNDEETNSDDEYRVHYGSTELPDQVQPKKLHFKVLKSYSIDSSTKEITKLLDSLTTKTKQSFSSNEGQSDKLAQLAMNLETAQRFNNTEVYWQTFWTDVRNLVFDDLGSSLSSYQFTSAGIASALRNLLDESCFSGGKLCQDSFLTVFENDMPNLISLFHSSLTRMESFEVLDCGLKGDEAGISSLGKQINIKLEYDGDIEEIGVNKNLQGITVSVHCIATFKTLNEFLKHRVVQSNFLRSMLFGQLSSNASLVNNLPDVKNLAFEFSIDDNTVDLNDTIFGGFYRYIGTKLGSSAELWNKNLVLNYKKTRANRESVELSELYEARTKEVSALESVEDILKLLAFVHKHTKEHAKHDIFVNSKLSAKLSRQLEEPLIVASGLLPSWFLYLTTNYPFLFPEESRLFYLQCISFGYGRLVHLWIEKSEKNAKEQVADEQLKQLGVIARHKLRLKRSTIFISGLKVLDKYGSSPSILEMEFQDEVGTGLGPTLEFYALMCKEFSKSSLGIWRNTDIESEYVSDTLFPSPLDACQDREKALHFFRYLGMFVARSMLDNRILDFNFNEVFFELCHEISCQLYTEAKDECAFFERLSRIDQQLAKSLKYIYEHKNEDSLLRELSLTLMLPGFETELVTNGREINVDSSNASAYIEKVIDQTIGSGVRQQLQHFISGFNEVFPYSNLLVLSPAELVYLFGSSEEDWSPEVLYSCISAEHGYTMDSKTIHDLISILSELDKKEKRLLLQFLTGSPKLPIGGFKGLKPKLTVVLKHAENNLTPDEYLPSVMTCANYLKLPKYSSKEIMRSRLKQAVEEGSGSFLLS